MGPAPRYRRLELIQPHRAKSGYRRYGQDEVRLLEFIARAKRLGLSLEQIRSLVQARRADDCRGTRGQLAEHRVAPVAAASSGSP